jgi:hypothetical protein
MENKEEFELGILGRIIIVIVRKRKKIREKLRIK